MSNWPALKVFREIPVVPVTAVHQHVALGGPIWPDFDRQTTVRHCRGGSPQDRAPAWTDNATLLMEDAVWGGFLDSHFGHFIADHLPRLPAALRERPDDVYLFTVDPGMTREGLGAWVWQVFDLIGLRTDQVRLVTEPLRVRCLRVGEQAESLPQNGPCGAYLDLVEHWARDLTPVPAPLLYVSRVGLPQQGGGAHAGEGYVVGLLERLGVAVLDPADAALRDQLAAYAGAERIIFAEGSAMHGRQLLGRLKQDIAVLRRRPDKRLAEAGLTPRCRSLSYHGVGNEMLMAYWKSGAKRPNPALSLYDVDKLQRTFAGFAVDLARLWHDDDFARAALRDITDWISFQPPNPRRLLEYRATIAAMGWALPL